MKARKTWNQNKKQKTYMFAILLFLKDVNNVNIDAKTIVAKPWFLMNRQWTG